MGLGASEQNTIQEAHLPGTHISLTNVLVCIATHRTTSTDNNKPERGNLELIVKGLSLTHKEFLQISIYAVLTT